MFVLGFLLRLLPSPPSTVHESAVRYNAHIRMYALLLRALWIGGLELRVSEWTMLLEDSLLRCLDDTVSTIYQ